MTAVFLFCDFFCFDDRLFKVGVEWSSVGSTAGTRTVVRWTDAKQDETAGSRAPAAADGTRKSQKSGNQRSTLDDPKVVNFEE